MLWEESSLLDHSSNAKRKKVSCNGWRHFSELGALLFVFYLWMFSQSVLSIGQDYPSDKHSAISVFEDIFCWENEKGVGHQNKQPS